jgi:hypothetical protein
MSTDTSGSTATVAATERASGFKVEPRTWLSWIDMIDESDISKEVAFLPMFGLTAGYSVGEWGFLLTGLYGEGEGDVKATDYDFKGTADYKRSDLEFLVRYNIPDSDVFLFFGPRYVHLEETDKFRWTEDGERFEVRNVNDSEVWLLEVGVGTTTNITPDGRHRLFANLIGGIGSYSLEWTRTWRTVRRIASRGM